MRFGAGLDKCLKAGPGPAGRSGPVAGQSYRRVGDLKLIGEEIAVGIVGNLCVRWAARSRESFGCDFLSRLPAMRYCQTC